jgi:hypothetical protein
MKTTTEFTSWSYWPKSPPDSAVWTMVEFVQGDDEGPSDDWPQKVAVADMIEEQARPADGRRLVAANSLAEPVPSQAVGLAAARWILKRHRLIMVTYRLGLWASTAAAASSQICFAAWMTSKWVGMPALSRRKRSWARHQSSEGVPTVDLRPTLLCLAGYPAGWNARPNPDA